MKIAHTINVKPGAVLPPWSVTEGLVVAALGWRMVGQIMDTMSPIPNNAMGRDLIAGIVKHVSDEIGHAYPDWGICQGDSVLAMRVTYKGEPL